MAASEAIKRHHLLVQQPPLDADAGRQPAETTTPVDDLFAAMQGGATQRHSGGLYERASGNVQWPSSMTFAGHNSEVERSGTTTSGRHRTDTETTVRCTTVGSTRSAGSKVKLPRN